MLKKLSLGVFLSSFVATPVFAKDFPGLRIEAYGGWDSVTGEVVVTDTDFPDDDFRESESTDGPVFGGAIGYDYPIGSGFYLGVEGSIEYADNERCEVIFGDDEGCFKLRRNYAIGGRLGSRLSKQTLFYVGGAYVNGKASVSYSDDIDPSNDFSISDSRDGFRISAGIEHRLSGRFYGKVEYRYSNYSDYSASVGTTSASLDFTRNQVVAGVGVRF